MRRALLLGLTLLVGCGFRTLPLVRDAEVAPPPPGDGGVDAPSGTMCDYLFAAHFDADHGRATVCAQHAPLAFFRMPAPTGASVVQCWRAVAASAGSGWTTGDLLTGGGVGTVSGWNARVTFDGRVYDGTTLYEQVVDVTTDVPPVAMHVGAAVLAVTSGAPYDYATSGDVNVQGVHHAGEATTLVHVGSDVAWMESIGGVYRLVVQSRGGLERRVTVDDIDPSDGPLVAASPHATSGVEAILVGWRDQLLAYAVPPPPGSPSLGGSVSLGSEVRAVQVAVSADGMHVLFVALTDAGLVTWRPPAAPVPLDVGGYATALVAGPSSLVALRTDGVAVELTLAGTVLNVGPQAFFPDATRVGTPLVSDGATLYGTTGVAVRTRLGPSSVHDGGPTFLAASNAFGGDADAAAMDVDLVVAVDDAITVLAFGDSHVCD